MGSMKKPTKVDLTFIKAPDYMMDDSDNKFIFDRLKIPDPWVKDLNKWIQYIKSDSKMICPDIVRESSALSMGLQFVDDLAISKLNSMWRDITDPTDVLSFPALDPLIDLPTDQCVELGDVFVSITTARKQAQCHNHDLVFELRWLVSHGFLHLLGWDHPNNEMLSDMLSCQEQLLNI